MHGGRGSGAALGRAGDGINTGVHTERLDAPVRRDGGFVAANDDAPVHAVPAPRHRARRATLGILWEAERHSGNAPIWIATALGFGAAQYFVAPREIGWSAIVAAAVVGATIAFAGRRAAHGGVLLLPLAFALGMAAAKGEAARAGTAMMVGEATTRIEARVESVTTDALGRVRYGVRIERTHDPTLQFAPDRARLFVSASHEALPIGSRMSALVRLRQPSGPSRPGGYDFAFHNYFEGLGAHGFVLGRPTEIAPPDGLTFPERVSRLRAGVASIVRERLDGPSGGVAAALLTGDKRGIPDEATEALRTAGLAHVLAISGMHMALVAGLVLVSVRFALALHPAASTRYPTKKIAAGAALAVASCYLVLSGGAVSAQRAHIMLCVMLLAVLLDRPALTMRNVGIAAVIVIALRPHEVTGPGFQMSFGATAALVAAYGAWQRRPTRGARDPWLSPALRGPVRFVAGLLFTSLVAGLATGIFAVHHFHRVAALGLLGNALAMPLVSIVVMPMAVVSALAMPFGLEGMPLAVMGAGIDVVLRSAAWVASLRPVAVTGAIGTPAFLAATLALVVAVGLRTRLAFLAALPLFLSILLIQKPGDALWVGDRSELVAVATDRGLAFARTRPNAFVSRHWTDATGLPAIPAGSPGGFACDAKDQLCTIETHGLVVASLRDVERLGEACDLADIVVSDRRLNVGRCDSGAPIIHARATGERGARTLDLASIARLATDRSGARSALRDVPDEAIERHATHAITRHVRPWTAHRHAVIRHSRPVPEEAAPPTEAGSTDAGRAEPTAVSDSGE